MTEHKHAKLLRMAADNADQLFECDDIKGTWKIDTVSNCHSYNWRPVKQTKIIKRWLWADKDGSVTDELLTQDEVKDYSVHEFTIKLLWSETEFEVSDD